MRRLMAILAVATALLAGPADGVVVTVFNGVSAASGTSGAIKTDGGTFTVQVCGGTGGDAFTGGVTITQGTASDRLVTVVSVSPSGLSGCSATYYIAGPSGMTSFPRSAFAGVSYTRSAGKLYVYLDWEPSK